MTRNINFNFNFKFEKKNRAHAKNKKIRKKQKPGQGKPTQTLKIRKARKWGMAASELPSININKPEQPFNRATAPMT